MKPKTHVDRDQLEIVTMFLPAWLIQTMEEIAKGSNSRLNDVARQALEEVFTPFDEDSEDA